jgi:hypothetical protein
MNITALLYEIADWTLISLLYETSTGIAISVPYDRNQRLGLSSTKHAGLSMVLGQLFNALKFAARYLQKCNSLDHIKIGLTIISSWTAFLFNTKQ